MYGKLHLLQNNLDENLETKKSFSISRARAHLFLSGRLRRQVRRSNHWSLVFQLNQSINQILYFKTIVVKAVKLQLDSFVAFLVDSFFFYLQEHSWILSIAY